MNTFKGIIPALITPVDENERFQPAVFEELIGYLYSSGVDGMYVCGQTGEGLQLSIDERRQAAEIAVRNSPAGKTVIVHVGAMASRDAFSLARHASQTGAGAISSLPPIGAYSFDEIRAYYTALASVSDVPLLIYYFPSIAPSLRTTDQILELCAIPNVIGLKFTDSNFFQLWAIHEAGLVVFNGSDEMLLPGLMMGADGGIGSTYNLIPEAFVTLYSLASKERWTEAREVQSQINRFIAPLLQVPVHAAIKALLRWKGMDCGHCIAPRRRLTAAEERELRQRVAATELGDRFLTTSAVRR